MQWINLDFAETSLVTKGLTDGAIEARLLREAT